MTRLWKTCQPTGRQKFRFDDNVTASAGILLGKLYLEPQSLGTVYGNPRYKIVGYSETAIAKVNFTYANKIMIFVAGSANNLHVNGVETSIGNLSPKNQTSVSFKAGVGINFGGSGDK